MEFGELVALKITVPQQKGFGCHWDCICSCGKEKSFSANVLLQNKTASCGHTRKLQGFIDIANKRFGKLVAKESLGTNSSRNYMWRCECDCGNENVLASGANLRNGNTQSCGCLKSKGELAIILLLQKWGFNYKTQYSQEKWRFKDTNRKGFFDFAILNDENIPIKLIEYDGIQHFQTSGWTDDEKLLKIQSKDKVKNDWAKQEGIPLYRIKYDQDIEVELRRILEV